MDEFSTIIIEFSNRITAPKSPCYYPFIFLKKYAKMSLLNRKGCGRQKRILQNKEMTKLEKTDILVINPGSTTTKIGLFRNGEQVFEENLRHEPDKLLAYGSIGAQLPYRAEVLRKVLEEKQYDVAMLKAVVGRGGMVIGLSGGGYRVNPALCEAMKSP